MAKKKLTDQQKFVKQTQLYNHSMALHAEQLDICEEDWQEDLRHHTKKRHIAFKMLKNLDASKKLSAKQAALNKQ